MAETWRQLGGGRILDDPPKGNRLGAVRRAGGGVWGGDVPPPQPNFWGFHSVMVAFQAVV